MTSRQNNRAHPGLEQLETRCLLAGQIFLDAATGALTINGTEGADHARVSLQGTQVQAFLSSAGDGFHVAQLVPFDASAVRQVIFRGLGDDDRFLNDLNVPATAWGGPGNDYLEGGNVVDKLFGEAGNDILVGFGGNDKLRGGGDNDYLFGMRGNDLLVGQGGADQLYGGLGKDKLQKKPDLRDAHGDGPLAELAAPFSEKLDAVTTPPAPPSTGLSALEQAIVDRTNQERRNLGLPALRVSAQLMDAARHHTRNMARLDVLAHELPGADLPNLDSRLGRYGYRAGWRGENVAWNYGDAASLLAGWMSSPGHRENILSANYTEIGVGVALNSLGEPYYCQVFGRPA